MMDAVVEAQKEGSGYNGDDPQRVLSPKGGSEKKAHGIRGARDLVVSALALTSSLAAASEGQAADSWGFVLPLQQAGVPPLRTVGHLLLPEPIALQDSGY